MKNQILTIFILLIGNTLLAQFQVEQAEQSIYNPNQLLERYNTVPQTYTPHPIYTPPPSTYTPQSAEKTIKVVNNSREVKQVEIYAMNLTNYKWEYIQTIRISGGSEFSHILGKYEQYNDYGYIIVGDYYKSVRKFSFTPVNLW